jgi:hypothetical protein
VLTKRRGFLALFGGGVAAAVTKTAVALPADKFVPAPSLAEVKPFLGEMRLFAECAPEMGSHCHSASPSIRVVKQIFDGVNWVLEDSNEGVDALNKARRFYQGTPTEGHQT